MLIDSSEKYIDELTKVWQKVFGDEKAYIDLLFNSVYKSAKTFAIIKRGEIASCLYLLPCKLRFENQVYSGFYLYAAATLSEYRNQGLMAKLIAQAQRYAEKNKFDFISLVPANEALYAYYEKFNFITAMHKYVSTSSKMSGENFQLNMKPASVEQVYQVRSKQTFNHFIWEKPELEYAMNCLKFYGTKAFASEKGYCLYNEKSKIISELMFKSSETDFDLQDIKINSPYILENYENKIEKFGMIFPINNKLKLSWSCYDIYMNLALD
ncbi:MAG: GNAT family N-acetyltransferase [Clostridia bacterium]